MRIAIYTLGCKVNQYETQAMEQELTRRGHEIVPFDGAADAYIVNTCSVTAVSDKKSRQMIRRCRKLNEHAVVAACGCYVQTHSDEAAAERTRAMLKVEDGCVNFCTYCIIPYARGPVRSLPKAEAVAQTRRLREEGYRELVITGIEISGWGHDLKNGETLIDLLEAVSEAAGDMRLRLGSLEPRTITEDFCRRAARLANLCPHFHLSMQSGCDDTLRRMNRKYDTARFYESVSLLRQYFDRPAITTDLITGFPGETEEEFAQTLAFIERCGFAAMHIFPYSVRPGTKAAAMPDQCTAAVKEQRAARAAETAERMKQAYLRGCIGQTYPVLFEQEKNGLYVGHAPNYCQVGVRGEDLHNAVRNVKIEAVDGDMLIGELT